MRPSRVSVPTRPLARLLRLLLLALLTAMLMPPARPAAQSGYALVQIPGAASASDVNDSGTVVGFWAGVGGSRGYLWTQDAGARPIITDPATINRFPLDGGLTSRWLRINASGVIAGQSFRESVGKGAATWSNDSGLQLLGSRLEGDDSQGSQGINSAGVVVGPYRGNAQIPFVWRPLAGFQFIFPLTHPGGAGAVDINDLEQVVGYCSALCTLDGTRAAYVWTSTGGRVLLPKVAIATAASNEGLAINNAGHVAGRFLASPGNPNSHAGVFFWSAGTGTVDLGAPPGEPQLVDINDDDDIVATITLPSGGLVPYLYRQGIWSNINDLRPAGSTSVLQTVSAINNAGWIVGNGGTVGGSRGYVLIPPPLNVVPVAQNGSASTVEDTPVSAQLMATDANGDPLTLRIETNGTRGTAAITDAATGSYTYTPNENAFGIDTVTFKANDGTSDSNAATVTVTINAVNDPPRALDSEFPGTEDTAVSSTLQAVDVENDTLTFSMASNPTSGSVTITDVHTGAFTYTPSANVFGHDSFEFQVSDGTSVSNVGTMALEIAPVNDAPVAFNGALTTTEDTSATGALTATDVDGPTLTFAVVTNGTKGVVTIANAATGVYTYAPAADINGNDTFTFQVSDGTALSNVATVAVSVTPVADPGVNLSAGSLDFGLQLVGSFSTAPRYSVGSWPASVAAADLDRDGSVDVVSANQISHTISVLLNNGDGTFRAGPSYATGTSPTAIVARDFSGDGKVDLAVTNQGSRDVSVLAGNGDGTFQAQIRYPSGQAASAGAFGVTAGDFNLDGALDLAIGSGAGINLLMGIGDGSFVVGGSFSAPGALDIANGDFNGDGHVDLATGRSVLLGTGDGTFQPAVSLNAGGDFLAVADYNRDGNLDVAIALRNNPSVVVLRLGNGTGMFTSGGSFAVGRAPFFMTAGDWNGDGNADLAVSSQFDSSVSVMLGNGDGTFQPSIGYGYYSFTQAVAAADLDGDGSIDLAVPITIGNGVSVLVGKGDGTFRSSLTVSVWNTGESPLHISAVSISGADAAAFFVEVNGCPAAVLPGSTCAIAVGFRPTGTGSKSAVLQINDDASGSPHQVTLTGSGFAVPVAQSGSISSDEDTPVTGQLMATNPGGAPLTFSVVTNAMRGTAAITNPSTGAFTFTPNANVFGGDAFTFHVSDGTSVSNVATMAVDIGPVNDAPLAFNSTVTTNEDTSASSVLAATDVDGPTLTFALVTNGTKGVVTMTNAAAGAYTYAPAANINGNDTFTFQVSDGAAVSNVATVSVTITPVSDPGIGLSVSSLNFGPQRVGSSSTAPRYSVGSWPAFVAAADFNGDGMVDLVSANQVSHTISVLLNNGNGTFRAAVSYATGTIPTAIVAKDFSGDGNADLAVTNQGSRDVSVLLGNGDGTFQAGIRYPSGQGGSAGAIGISAADFNQDGKLDLAISGQSSINLLLGAGNGTFLVGGSVTAPGAFDVASGDFNGDGHIDLATGGYVLLGNGDGTFQPAASLNTGGTFLAVADYNGDSRPDVAVALRGNPSVVMLRLGNGDGTFTSGGSFSVGRAPFFMTAGDWNGDGNADLAVSSEFDSSVSVLLGNGDGTFQTSIEYGYHPFAESVAAADLDGDGSIDLAVANAMGGSVSVLLGSGHGTFHSSLTVVVRNIGDAPLHIGTVSTAGVDAAAFFVEAKACPAALDPGSSCPIAVGFRPTGTGSKSAVLQIYDDASGSPHQVTLTGSGFALPVAQNGSIASDEDTPATGQLVATNPGGAVLTFTIVTNGTLATAAITNPSTGAFTLLPNANVSGQDAFTFQVSDGTSVSNVAAMQVEIRPVNDAPAAIDGTLTTTQDVPVSGTLVGSDVDGPSLTFAIVANGGKGLATITDSATGAFTYTPNAGSSGTDIVTFKANDGALDSNIGSLTVNIVASPIGVSIVAPNGGQKVFVNVPVTIRWSSNGGPTSLDVTLSRNGAAGPFTALAGCSGLTGTATSCSWIPSGAATTNALIRITAHRAAETAIDSSDATFAIATGTPSITVTAPNTAVSWAVGTTQTIAWNHNLGAQASVRLELSRNGGTSWETIVSAMQNTAAGSGTFLWTVTGQTTATALVRVTWLDGLTTDTSNAAFAVVAPQITVIAPNTAVNWVIGTTHNVAWSHNLGAAETVRIEASRDGGVTWSSLAPNAPNTGNTTGAFAWIVTGPVTAAARVRVTWVRNAAALDVSDVNFGVTSAITVTQPNTAVTWGAGSTRTITWNYTLGASQLFDIEFSADNGATWAPLASEISASSANTGAFTGTMPEIVTAQALIRVSPAGRSGDGDSSNARFSLAAPVLTVTSPNTAVNWVIGSTHNINWSHNLGASETVQLETSRDGGATWTVLAAGAPNIAATSGTFSWFVTGPATTTGRIRARWSRNGAIQDVSDASFAIVSAITVTAPNSALTWSAGSTRAITWNHTLGGGKLFDIQFSPDNGANWTPLASGVGATATTGIYTGVMPTAMTTQALIRVSPSGIPGDGDVSNVPFTLAPPTVVVTAPNTNVNWAIASPRSITWSHNLGTSEAVNIDISRDGGTTWSTVASSVPNAGTTAGTYAYTAAGPATTAARIRVTWVRNQSAQDVSNVNFRIQ